MKDKWTWMNRCTGCQRLTRIGAPKECACIELTGVVRVRLDADGTPIPTSSTSSTAPPPSTEPPEPQS